MLIYEKSLKPTELLEAFKDYYDYHSTLAGPDPCKEDADRSFYWLRSLIKHSFPTTMSEYQYYNQELHKIWQNSVCQIGDFKMLGTTGTSNNKSRHYRFGPKCDHWISSIWDSMAYQFGWRPTIFVVTNAIRNTRQIIVEKKEEGLYQWRVKIYQLDDEQVIKLLELLHKLIKQYGYITLITFPSAYLFLNETPAFLDFCEAYRDRMNLISWSWEPFFKKTSLRERGIWFGDQMVDWTSGLNFYTCKHSHQHVLPIFINTDIGPANALNMIKQTLPSGEGGDSMEITDIVQCSCGLTRPIYNYHPHFRHSIKNSEGRIFFDPDLPNELKSRYRSLQFIQTSIDEITVHYDIEGPMLDKPFLESVVQDYGFKVDWKDESFIMSGRKLIPFFSLKS